MQEEVDITELRTLLDPKPMSRFVTMTLSGYKEQEEASIDSDLQDRVNRLVLYIADTMSIKKYGVRLAVDLKKSERELTDDQVRELLYAALEVISQMLSTSLNTIMIDNSILLADLQTFSCHFDGLTEL